MATKNKTKKKQTESKRTAGKKVTPIKKAIKKKLAKKSATPKKKAKKKATAKKAAVKTKADGKKTTGGKTEGALIGKRHVRGKSQSVDTVAVSPEGHGARAGEESGDLQGLSNLAGADSESVDELLEEGNAFKADVINGVENALDPDDAEVTTHEVPEDDVSSKHGGES